MDLLKPGAANLCPLTPITFLERSATVYGDCTSLVYNGTTYTWSETYRRCLQLTSSIASLGVRRLQVVSVLAPNVPASSPSNGRTISVLLRHGESKLVFSDFRLRSLLLEAMSLYPTGDRCPILVLITDDVASSSLSARFHATHDELVKSGDPGFEWAHPETEWDPLTLNYTSGTTSSPKGVVHSHRGVFIMTLDSLIDKAVPKHPTFLWTFPMFHSSGWNIIWGMAAVGGTNICLPKFDPPVAYAAIEKHNVTHMCGAPVVLNMLSTAPNAKPLKNPVHILTGGSPPPAG
ncbi:hypothetical protein RJ639_042266 [Escallonia herrerae]|uniref:AMP-dependent synthetase/ligase domain-containing protein n=1 Tax=Escallonia herrerae TaxID=1293975 RepID=A0AA88WU42_9ASTE|nr:hypothetical protein RJ639_042266 [Escallonia herrerae]